VCDGWLVCGGSCTAVRKDLESGISGRLGVVGVDEVLA